MSRKIINNVEEKRFQWVEDGQLSVLDYRIKNGIMSITHTEVPPEIGGRGIAKDLTTHALDTARENGWKVRVFCSYVSSFIDRHPEYADLLD